MPRLTASPLAVVPKPIYGTWTGLSHVGANRLNAVSQLTQKGTVVQGFSLFADVPSIDCENIIAAAREKRFKRRETIFSEGDPVRQILLLLSGCVKIKQIGVNGSEVILRLSGHGEIVGAFRLGAQSYHCSTAQATQPCVALIWEAAAFEKILERYPTFRRNTVRALEERLREMEQRFREVSTEKVGPRLSSQLIRLSSQVGRAIDGQVEISLSRAELAQLTGTTVFTVSRLLCQWQTLGIVSARREAVLVRNVAALTELAHSE
jgi:CRP-like cAMP-binding protein